MLGLMFKKEASELAHLLRHEQENLVDMLSPYGARYFKTLLKNAAYNVQLSAILLEKVIDITKKSPGEIALIDYGGGLGITGLLAKKAGFKSILYVDIYDIVKEDAQKIGQYLGLSSDRYIDGDMDRVIKAGIEADALVSRDVVEHIYDLTLFFNQCAAVPGLNTLVHNTSANIYNVLLKSYFNKIHFKAEYQQIRDKQSVKKGESQMGYFYARKEIIEKEFPYMDPGLVSELSRLTRGYHREDILGEVKWYMESEKVKTGERNMGVTHPTNTCEPYTGNWAERLLTFGEYRSYAQPFSLTFHPGPYNVKRAFGVKKILLSVMNFLILKLRFGPWIWPSIVIVMTRKPGDTASPERLPGA